MWVAGIFAVAVLAWLWRDKRGPRPFGGVELQRLRRTADAMRRDQFHPFEYKERAMNNLEQDYTQPLGLDVGTSRVVVARAKDKKHEYDSSSTRS